LEELDSNSFQALFSSFFAFLMNNPGYAGEAKPYRSRLSISEVMTIVIAWHGSGFRTFKDF
jgi:hypothetical protein